MLFPSLRNRGGFFSDYYLGTVFGRASGRQRTLVTRDLDIKFRILSRLDERAEGRVFDAPLLREQFARPLLRDVLGFHLGAGEAHVHPLYASADEEASGRPPLVLAYVGAWDEDLDAAKKGQPPPSRGLAEALARAQADLRYGILLTGQGLRLIRRRGDGPRGAFLELDLPACLEAQDRESFAVAWRIFQAANFQPSPDGVLPIDAIERESREHAARVSDDLRRAVFQAAEVLVQGLIDDWAARAGDEPRDPVTLPAEELARFRDAALTFLYRLLFILYAEARDDRLLAHPVYKAHYSLSALVDELLGGRQTLSASRHGLWERLLALFHIHGDGIPAAEGLERIPARGGDLFDPKTAAGRLLEEARLDDQAVATLVLDLATTAPRQGVGHERISFRELDIEQLGAVYEGLLEYEPRIATGTTIEVRVQGRAYALPPRELVRLVREKNLILSGDRALVEGTEAEGLHPEAGEEPEGESEEPDVEDAAEEGEEAEAGLRRGATALLVRRLERGAFYFVPGHARKGSGSFYTPLPLVHDLVRHALGPLVEGKSAAEIERLRVLDPACGSAHFLVEAMRFLGQHLHRTYIKEYGGKSPPGFRGTWDTDSEASDEDARAVGSEARAWCKRRVAERCLFGVDLNPMAVNLARVSIWIESLAGDRPLTYFEHHIRSGNSILGTWLERLGKPPLPDMESKSPPGPLFADTARRLVRKAAEDRSLIDGAADVGAVEPDTLEEQRFKEAQRRRAEETLAGPRLLFHLRSASAFVPAIWSEWETLCSLLGDAGGPQTYAESRPWWGRFREVLARERFFHWELEFPEVFLDGEHRGFDAVLGNPPWDKVKPDRKEFYGRHDILIRAYVGGELDRRIGELHADHPGLEDGFYAYEERIKTAAACLRKSGDYRYQDWEVGGKKTGGDPDAFKFFVEQAWRLVREGGRVGLVVPSAIYNNEGCTGIRHLLLYEAQVERFYGFENRKKIFPIDSRYKFVSLVFRKGKPEADGSKAAFMRHDLAELADPSPKPWMVLIRRRELERLSPGTLAFLEYRGARDREILLRMYGHDSEGKPLRPSLLLGDQGPGTWNARFYRELDMTNDRDLWTDPKTGKLYTPRQVLGFEPRALPETCDRMAEKGFWPLYQDAHIHQYVLAFKPIMRWVKLEAHQRKYGRLPNPNPKLVVRDPARNTDERTCIAAVLPPNFCFGHTLNGVAVQTGNQFVLASILNCMTFDFAVRLRVGGQHVSPYLLERCPVLKPDDVGSLTTEMITANERPTWIYDIEGLWPRLSAMELHVAQAYGITPDDFAHVLESFPVFARKRPKFYEYMKERLVEWKREQGGS